MLGIGISGLALTTEEHDWLQHPAVTSVILFARNFASRDQVAELSAAIRAAAARPILLAAACSASATATTRCRRSTASAAGTRATATTRSRSRANTRG